MPHNYPAEPDYGDPGFDAEAMVWRALQDLPDEAVVLSQVRVLHERRAVREADFVVLLPGFGIAVIEVKGGGVFCEDGQWLSEDRNGERHRIADPVKQADNVGFLLLRHVVDRGGEWPHWRSMAVLPQTVLPRMFAVPGTEPGQWAGADELSILPARIEDLLFDEVRSAGCDSYAVASVVRLLEHELRRPAARDRAAADRARTDIITRDQYAILRALRSNSRIVVTGGPGTGKTWLALEHARAETARGARAALLCYNRALATSLRATAAGWPADEQPAYIGTLHRLALDASATAVPDPVPEGFWDTLPDRLLDAPLQRFDVVVVDEAQDYRPQWWPAVLSLLSDRDEGQLVVFRDDEQTLYDSGPLPLEPAVGVELTENVRNTQQIAAALAALPGGSERCRGVDGPVPELVAAPAEGVLEEADRVVADLLDSGDWAAGDIALLTTWSRHPQHKRLAEQLGPDGYSRLLAGTDELAVSTVMSFKGLERPVVVLAVNGFRDPARADDVLRVGMSRPTHRLIVVADPRELRRVGGDALLARLEVR